MPRTTPRSSITLVGRASQLAFREFESGATRASFTLTVKAVGDRPPLVVECEGWGTKVREQFELMDEGSLVGIIGTLLPRADDASLAKVRLDRLEYLGKPLAAA
jgi:hypothetical protein